MLLDLSIYFTVYQIWLRSGNRDVQCIVLKGCFGRNWITICTIWHVTYIIINLTKFHQNPTKGSGEVERTKFLMKIFQSPITLPKITNPDWDYDMHNQALVTSDP